MTLQFKPQCALQSYRSNLIEQRIWNGHKSRKCMHQFHKNCLGINDINIRRLTKIRTTIKAANIVHKPDIKNFKRSTGHIAHQRKQFKSITTYDYIITLIRRKKPLSSFWELYGSLFEQTLIPFSQGCFVQSLVETVPVALEKIFKFCQCIFVTS